MQSMVGEGQCNAHLFSVVDFPDEGLPTKPISGSRGMAGCV
jgi:ferredoxin